MTLNDGTLLSLQPVGWYCCVTIKDFSYSYVDNDNFMAISRPARLSCLCGRSYRSVCMVSARIWRRMQTSTLCAIRLLMKLCRCICRSSKIKKKLWPQFLVPALSSAIHTPFLFWRTPPEAPPTSRIAVTIY